MRDLSRAGAIQGIGKGVSLGNRHGRQGDAVGHVADGVYGRNRTLRTGIHHDLALSAKFDARSLEAESGRVRHAARRRHDLGYHETSAVAEGDGLPAVLVLNTLNRAARMKDDAAPGKRLGAL